MPHYSQSLSKLPLAQCLARLPFLPSFFFYFFLADWDDSETSLAHLSSNTTGGASGLSISGERNSTGGGVEGSGAAGNTAGGMAADHLWEDNWDDDDVEDDFSKALRCVSQSAIRLSICASQVA